MTIIIRALTVLWATVAAAIGASPSLAQPAAPQSGDSSPPNPQMNAPAHPSQNQWGRDRDWYEPPGGYGYGYAPMGPHAGWMGGGPGWMMGHRPGWGHHGRWHRGPRGAHFTFTRGNGRVDIQCPANQSLKECVDAAGTLIDKVSSMGPPPPPPPPGAPKPPAGPDNPPANQP